MRRAPITPRSRAALAATSFRKKLRRWRLDHEVTLVELSAKSGLDVTTIGHFESGRRRPSLENLRLLCLGLGVSADYLLGISGL
jgi:transcriptional regulator with XRE-family HTH domain